MEKNRQGLGQSQVQVQTMVALPMSIQVGQMLEKSADEIMRQINDELNKNLALEQKEKGPGHDEHSGEMELQKGEEYDPRKDYKNTEDMPSWLSGRNNQRGDDDEVYVPPVVEEESLFDHLMEQLRQLDLTEDDLLAAEYVVGNIDSNGYLRRDAYSISTDILLKESIMVEEEQVEKLISLVKTLDPIGIGAADVRECLMLQLRVLMNKSVLAQLAYKAVDKYLADIANRHFDKLCQVLKVDEAGLEEVLALIRRLNPRPGAGFVSDRVVEHATPINPEFSVVYDKDSKEVVVESLSRIPELQVSESYKVAALERRDTKSRAEKADRKLIRDYVKSAEELIELLRIRQDTLMRVVRAIVVKQRDYFVSLNEADLRPLKLEDIALIVGKDVSVISRATREKYIQTEKGCVPFKFFFSEGLSKNVEGDSDEVSTREIVQAIKTLIDGEDKRKPLTDQALADELNKMGYQVARRTVTKYRETKLNLPVAKQRKELVAPR